MAKNQPPVRKIPERKCTGCGQSKPKAELIRVVRSPEGDISVDVTGKKSGRGAYICKSADCLKKARKNGRLSKNLECAISEEIYDALEEKVRASEGE